MAPLMPPLGRGLPSWRSQVHRSVLVGSSPVPNSTAALALGCALARPRTGCRTLHRSVLLALACAPGDWVFCLLPHELHWLLDIETPECWTPQGRSM